MKIKSKPNDSALDLKIIAQVNMRLSALKRGEKYTLAGILGKDYWDSHETAHRATGQRFSKLVREGRTPFIPTDLSKDRHNQYYFNG